MFSVIYLIFIKHQQNQREGGSIFRNKLLNYEIQYEKPWRISNALSRKNSEVNYLSYIMSEMGCDESIMNFSDNGDESQKLMDKDIGCIKNNPKYNEYMNQISNFTKNWSIENSDVVIFTNWTQEEENHFLSQISKDEKTLWDVIDGENIADRIISIYPNFGDMTFSEEKSTTTERNGKKITIENKILSLANNKKAYLFNNNGSLLISIPRALKTGTFVGETTGLIFRAKLDDNKNNEKAFYNMLYSLKLK